ncbi:hypothetical protein [Pseudomonas sp. ICMP 561]|uniref:hypothetical protein n=1 Tax=Pseudomonas sp. ICMP 561 TaxID=1718918 RepID=UPI000C088C50|nr:hypothetical protein [Pseudomonas sp. ICMP 561]PHN28984.1 hypothetical protein AO242_26225 [Pseudomonas sp. ICMP 561]
MSWYRAGTVSVAQNSTTVTGAATAFAANSRVGDGFVGPDGREYEVTNIASDRVLSILPAYKGETVAGGTYAVIPIQGYNKATADALRKVSESFVDVTSSVEAAAQSAAAANEDRLAVDLAADKVAANLESAELAAQTAGQHETNAANSASAANQSASAAGQSEAQANQYRQAAAASAAAAAASEGNVSNKVNVSDIQDLLTSTAINKPLSANQGRVLANQIIPVERGGTGSTTSASARTALGLKSASTADIVGVVADGAIIESASNSNGYFVKYADGTLLCSYKADGVSQAITASTGSIFQAGAELTWTYPVAFIAPPIVNGNASRNDGTVIIGCFIRAVSATATLWRLWSSTAFSAGNVKDVLFTAVGRWKA